jgi:hypothetical protein
MPNQAPRPPLSSTKSVQQRPTRAPIQWAGILFAVSANVLLVNVADYLVKAFTPDVTFEAIATFGAPLLVGIATTWYVKRRGGIHAFIGGMLSIPLLALTVFEGNWQFAIIAGAICGLGGSLSEMLLQRTGR